MPQGTRNTAGGASSARGAAAGAGTQRPLAGATAARGNRHVWAEASTPVRQAAVLPNYWSSGSAFYVSCCAWAAGGERERLRGCYSNQEKAAVLNGLEFSTFPGVRESLAHACWGLWNPLASRTVRNLASDRPLRRRRSPSRPPSSSTPRRRTKPRWQPPQRPRTPFTRLAAFVSRNLLRPSARSAFLFLRSPHPESQVQRAGTPPFLCIPSPDQPHLCPPSLFGFRSRKEPKRRRKKPKLCPVREAFPKRWRKKPKFIEGEE